MDVMGRGKDNVPVCICGSDWDADRPLTTNMMVLR